MLIELPKADLKTLSPYRAEAPFAKPADLFPDEVRVDEEEIVPANIVRLEKEVRSLYEPTSPAAGYASETGLYFFGRRPDCTVVGLARSNTTRSAEFRITKVQNLLQMRNSIREEKQPYSLFVIDALAYDALSGVEAIVQETARNRFYYNHRPLMAVVERNAPGLVSRLAEKYSGSPLRFIEAQKYGSDVIDANLFGQLRY